MKNTRYIGYEDKNGSFLVNNIGVWVKKNKNISFYVLDTKNFSLSMEFTKEEFMNIINYFNEMVSKHSRRKK